jgi:hypothetical protein
MIRTVVLLAVANVFMTTAWYAHFSAAQLKTIQEILTLAVFAGFSIVYLKEALRWNHLVAFLLIVGAAYFMFKR